VPNSNDPVVPLDPSVTLRGGTCCMGYSLSPKSPCPGLHPTSLHHIIHHPSQPGEDTPATPLRRHNTESSSLPVISHRSIGVECGARGCSRRWSGSSHLIGQLPPASSWAAPSQKGVVPPQSAFLIGCMGIRRHPTSRLQPPHQTTTTIINARDHLSNWDAGMSEQ